ncbi:MAG TPA: transposase [Bryobacteraceae bacterium]|jgi:transposase|nr:transposase [Bryobacteraceae bacterium]
MDGSAQSSPKPEAVGAKRRKWSEEERDRIVRASLQGGTTVEAVARVYGVNASQIYDWRKQHRQRVGKGKRSVLLPVHVAEGAPIVMPETKQECSVVIEARSVRVTMMSGCIDAAVICAVLERLAG